MVTKTRNHPPLKGSRREALAMTIPWQILADEVKPHESILRPRRIEAALKAAKSLEEFRRNRPFKFLYLYSGPNDPLGEALRLEAARNRLETVMLYWAWTTRRIQTWICHRNPATRHCPCACRSPMWKQLIPHQTAQTGQEQGEHVWAPWQFTRTAARSRQRHSNG